MAFNSKKIGILGGGQLGRMLIQSAIDFDFKIKVLDPDPNAPCKSICDEFEIGQFTDYDTVMNFAKDCDIITIEIESVNLKALFELEKSGKEVYPQAKALEIIKDKRKQKVFFLENQLPTADFILTENRADVAKYMNQLPWVNKIGEGGYDGKGVQILKSTEDLAKAFDSPSLLEKLIDFEKELAVIVARNTLDEITTFEVVEMVFHPEANLVEYLFSPANISPEIEQKAKDIALKTAQALNIIGLLAVEMFLTKDGEILINEVAPRPHNSGHHTQKANPSSQFEQHLRAITGLPLNQHNQGKLAAMVNILGENGHEGKAVYYGLEKCIGLGGIHPFLYGKAITKPFRKMGHVTIIADDFDKLKERVKFVQNTLKVIAE